MKNDDYLWAKIGTDPEIEQLENALSVFRHRQPAEPVPAVNVIPFRPRPRKNRLAFAYAAAASLLLAALAGSAWLRKPGTDDAKLPEAPAAEEMRAPLPQPDSVEPQKQARSTRTEVTRTKVTRTNAVARANFLVAAHRKPLPKANPDTTKQSLTKEEKYAYDSLMLALAITSTNLQLVAEKIESPNASADSGR
jgi:hypothetical protein